MTPEELPAQPWRRSGSSRRRPLSVDAIVEAALQLLDTEGLDAVTMRRVAQRLDTGAASLYAHVSDKAELHELMLDAVMAEAVVPEPDPACWADQLKQAAADTIELLASRSGIARITLETLIPTTPHTLDHMDRLLGLLRAGGLTEGDVLRGADVLALYISAAAYEQSLRATAAAQREAAERIDQIGQYLRLVPIGRLPHLAALAPAMTHQDGGYRFGLDLLIDGLVARGRGSEHNGSRQRERVSDRSTS